MIETREAVQILEQYGFRIPYASFDTYSKILYNDERVGSLYRDQIYLASEFPHLRNQSYADTNKQGSIRLYSRTARSDLEQCIQVLFNSPALFEEEFRNERAKKVKEYFEYRNIEKEEIKEYYELS